MPRFHPAAALALMLAACAPQPATTVEPEPESSAATPIQPPPAPAAPAPPAPPESTPATPALAIDGEGLRLFNRQSGSARSLPFGTPRARVMAALAFRGPPGTGTNGECGAGPLGYASWPDGLTLYFQKDKFAGWAADRRGNDGTGRSAIATAASVGPGSTRAELESAYAVRVFESTLGTEFAASDLFGLLDGTRPTSRITTMWAGASCNMR